MLESGKVDTNIQTNNGETPLHFAGKKRVHVTLCIVRNMNVEMVQLLITTGQAKLEIASPTDGTPLQLANTMFGNSGTETPKTGSENAKIKDKIIGLLGGKRIYFFLLTSHSEAKFNLVQSIPKSPSDNNNSPSTPLQQPGTPVDPGNKR